MQHEGGTFPDVLQRMTARRRRARGLVNSRQQHHGDNGERGGKSKGRRGTRPSDQHAAQRGSTGEGNGAREFDPRVCGGQ